MTRLLRSAALALVLVMLTGCGDLPGPSDQGTARERAAGIVEDVRRAVEEAKARAEAETGDVQRGGPPQGTPIRTDTQTAFDDERYNQTLEGIVAAAHVLAHEFGHAIQARSPQQERLTVLSELQADCFAGAWAAHVEEQGQLEAGDLDEATFAVLGARDVPGTPFTDPRAHGTGFERTRAFSSGYGDGPQACAPAPADEWLVTTTR